MFADPTCRLMRSVLQVLALMSLAQAAFASEAMAPCTWCAAAAAQASRTVVAPAANKPTPAYCRTNNEVTAGCKAQPEAAGEVDAVLPSGAATRFKLRRETSFGMSVVRGTDSAGRRLLMVFGEHGGTGAIDSTGDQWDLSGDRAGSWSIGSRPDVPFNFGNDTVGASPSEATLRGKPSSAPASQAPAGAVLGEPVDMLMLYTPELAKYLGGSDATIERSVFLTELLNDALAASQISGTFNLVGIEESDAPNDELAHESVNRILRVGSSGQLKRDAYGADVMVLIKRWTKENTKNGVIGVGGGDSAALSIDGTFETCNADGYCSTAGGRVDHVFLHELGHVMGGGHELGLDATGRFPYSHAYIGCGSLEGGLPKGTIVVQRASPVRYFSNPAVTNEGFVCGDASTADNARTIREVLPILAAMRAPNSSGAPTVKVGADRSSIALGESTSIAHFAGHAQSCAASGDWSGMKSSSGREIITPATEGTFTYALTCTGPGGTSTASTVVNVVKRSPSVSILLRSSTDVSASPSVKLTEFLNIPVRINWTSSLASSCVASGAWFGAKATSGFEDVGPSSTGTFAYDLTCSGPGGDTMATAVITVVAPTATVRLSSPSVPGAASEVLSVSPGATVTISWSSENSLTCSIGGGGWAGEKATSGSETVTAPTTAGTVTYYLECGGRGPIARASATLTVAVPKVCIKYKKGTCKKWRST